MEFKYITEFVSLVDIGKFSDAAEALYISQSSLSKHMKTLEEELGVPLFERATKRRVQLSSFGKLFLPYAEQITILYKEYLELQHKSMKKLAPSLTIGSIPAMAQYNITSLLAEFRKAHPEIILNVEEMDSSVSIEKVLQGKLDVAFIRESPNTKFDYDRLNRIRYTSDTLCAILPVSHPLANKDSVTLLELKNENFIFLDGSSYMYELCMEECLQAGFSPNVVYTSNRGNNIINIVGLEGGVSLLTKRPVSNMSHDKVRILDIVPTIWTQINLIYNKNLTPSPDARLFLDFFKNTLSDSVNEL